MTVIDLKRGLKKAEIDTADFSGVPLRGPVRAFTPGSTVEQDLEPEYITTDGDWAWVSIQEASAIGILDVEDAESSRFAASASRTTAWRRTPSSAAASSVRSRR